MSSKIAIKSCESYDLNILLNKISDGVNLVGGFSNFIKNGDRVLLKPNFLAAKPVSSHVTTHPNFILACAKLILECNPKKVAVADSPAIASATRVASKIGLIEPLKKIGVEVLNLKHGKKFEGNRKIYKKLVISEEISEFNKIINLPKIKTHAQMLLTCAVKNMFGCVPGADKFKWHFDAGHNYELFGSMLAHVYKAVPPTLNIVDGIFGMEGNGPGAGDPRKIGIILAAQDAVAIDFIVAKILNIDPNEVKTITEGVKLGIGQIENIEILGEDYKSFILKDFKLPRSYGMPAYRSLEFARSHIQNAISHKPVINKKTCTLCGICIKHCPSQIMKIQNKKVTIDYKKCIRCFCCQEICEENAIRIKKGWLLRIIRK